MRAAAPRADGESSEGWLCGLREDDEFVWGKVRVACAEQTRKGASAMQGRDLDVKLLRAPLTMVRAPFGRPAYKYSTAARTAHNTSAALGGSAPSQGGRQPRALQGTERRRGRRVRRVLSQQHRSGSAHCGSRPTQRGHVRGPDPQSQFARRPPGEDGVNLSSSLIGSSELALRRKISARVSQIRAGTAVIIGLFFLIRTPR